MTTKIIDPNFIQQAIDGVPDIKPVVKRSDSLLEIFYSLMQAIVAADQEGVTAIETDFLKYNKFIDSNVNRHIQNFLFESGFSVSSESYTENSYLNIKIKWHSKDAILRLVHFVINNIDAKEIFK